MSFIFGVLFWLGVSIAIGVAANARERSGFGWFVFAFLLSPLIALLALLLLPNRRLERLERLRHEQMMAALLVHPPPLPSEYRY